MYIKGLCHKTHTPFPEHALTAMLEVIVASMIILNLEEENNTIALTETHYHTDMS